MVSQSGCRGNVGCCWINGESGGNSGIGDGDNNDEESVPVFLDTTGSSGTSPDTASIG